jgi:hypothetical protein
VTNAQQQLDLFDTNIFHCDHAPVRNLSQFFDFVETHIGRNPPKGALFVSPPIPLRSGAGWYVGRSGLTFDERLGRWVYEPYDRMSNYYLSEAEATDVADWHRWGCGHPPV